MATNNELLAVFEYLERERGLDRETLARAVEEALLTAVRKGSSKPDDLQVRIDRKTLEIKSITRKLVIETPTDRETQIALKEARRIKANVVIGDHVEVESSPQNLGRIAAQAAKQAIMQRIRQVERERIFEEYKDRPGDIVSGGVRDFMGRDVIVDLGRAEGRMPGAERVPIEDYQRGERIRALVLSVENEARGPEIILSRAHPDFVRRLFELEVAEIADGTVEIKGIAREAGFRTKLAVYSHDEKVDPVGACVGMRGMRVKNIVRELSGEKIDIVRWHEDIRHFVANSLAPAKIGHLTLDEASHTVTIVVDSDQLSLAIGKKGQNARLTSKLTGWRIEIERDQQHLSFEEKVAQAIATLAKIEQIGPERAEALVQAGFLTLEGLLAADIQDLQEVEGFTAELAEAAHAAAAAVYEKEHGPIVES
ncbi:MAG: transcription termination factor NusA, partial [Kiritimatiellia bacterium]|nr:transcription termination factor NusA [Kiritimatiellia bacterium]